MSPRVKTGINGSGIALRVFAELAAKSLAAAFRVAIAGTDATHANARAVEGPIPNLSASIPRNT
jgi:hypothetical protein